MAATRLLRMVNAAPIIFARPPCLFMTSSTMQNWLSSCRDENDDTKVDDSKTSLFLHIGPSGDCWTGPSIFAAKHLQPDYVRSVALPPNFHDEGAPVDALLDAIEEDSTLQHQIYDEERIPESLLEKVRAAVAES